MMSEGHSRRNNLSPVEGIARPSRGEGDYAKMPRNDSNTRAYGSQRSRGYPTSHTSMTGRLDDDDNRAPRDRSRSVDYHKRDGSRSWDRSHHHRQPSRSGNGRYYGPNYDRDYDRDEKHDRDVNYDRDERHHRSRFDSEHGHRYGPAEDVYEEDSQEEFRRDRSSGGRSEPPFKRNRRVRSSSRDNDSPGRRNNRSLPLVAGCEWPPCFDDEGSAFVFHPASAMFYEERSDFFYDPKARLYYGAKKKAYFRYDDSQVPPFVETERVDAAQGTPLEPVAPLLLLPPTSGATSEKHKIVINLKTKKTKRPQTSTAAEGASSSPIIHTKVQKMQVENIEKWQIKQAELKAESSVPVVPIITEIQRTANGEPICVICQRKFPTVEKFRLHEAKSELHKSNLAKQTEGQQASQITGADEKKGEIEHLPAAQQYNNRAEKRRFLHGSSYPEPFQSKVVGSDMVLDAPQGDSLGETNIGNKLLQSMGWQTGAALGGRTNNDDQNTKSSGDIRKEWDRIEAIAAKKRGPDF